MDPESGTGSSRLSAGRQDYRPAMSPPDLSGTPPGIASGQGAGPIRSWGQQGVEYLKCGMQHHCTHRQCGPGCESDWEPRCRPAPHQPDRRHQTDEGQAATNKSQPSHRCPVGGPGGTSLSVTPWRDVRLVGRSSCPRCPTERRDLARPESRGLAPGQERATRSRWCAGGSGTGGRITWSLSHARAKVLRGGRKRLAGRHISELDTMMK
jgi:hypothetical protein